LLPLSVRNDCYLIETGPAKPPLNLASYFVIRIVVQGIFKIACCLSGKSFYFSRDFGTALLGKFHNQREVFASASCGRLVALLSEHHILSGETPNFDQQLAGSASLSAPVKEATFLSTPSLRSSRRWPQVLLPAIFFSAVFPCAAFRAAPIDTFLLCHFSLQ
jgi:hypothetical protein